MLLNRRRINKWARWVALALAVVFGVSFAFLGVGSGMPGMDFSQLWTNDATTQNRETPEGQSPEEMIEEYQAQLAQDPTDYNALVGIATQYEILGESQLAAEYLEQAIEQETENADLHRRLANIYLNPETADDEAAVRVLNRLTELEPENAQAFLQLGVAHRNLGSTNAAALAWNRYLELAPDSDVAETVRAELAAMTAQTETENQSGDQAPPATDAGEIPDATPGQ